jgi:hypothetical protein
MPQSAPPPLRLGFAGLPDTPPLHLSVDGMTPDGPNLSHWPGNRTPPQWKADLSSGICLCFARSSPEERRSFLAGATTVLNDHYDTDGFGSLLAVLRPDVAMAREELVLAAAATGDFGSFQTWRAFAVDRIVAGLAEPASPVAAEFRGVEGPARGFARYRWLLDHADDVLDHPEVFAALYHDELRHVQGEIDAGRRGALQRHRHAELGFAVLQSGSPQHRMTLNTLAGAYRVLHSVLTPDGPLHRYHDRTESWFELATFHAPLRRDLRPVCARLAALEPGHGGASWCADPPTAPIPELWFGEPAEQDYGAVTRVLRPSRLPASVVERELAAQFAEPGA